MWSKERPSLHSSRRVNGIWLSLCLMPSCRETAVRIVTIGRMKQRCGPLRVRVKWNVCWGEWRTVVSLTSTWSATMRGDDGPSVVWHTWGLYLGYTIIMKETKLKCVCFLTDWIYFMSCNNDHTLLETSFEIWYACHEFASRKIIEDMWLYFYFLPSDTTQHLAITTRVITPARLVFFILSCLSVISVVASSHAKSMTDGAGSYPSHGGVNADHGVDAGTGHSTSVQFHPHIDDRTFLSALARVYPAIVAAIQPSVVVRWMILWRWEKLHGMAHDPFYSTCCPRTLLAYVTMQR